MALSFRRKSTGGTVGLDLDGGYAAAVEISGGRILRAAHTELGDGMMIDGEVVDPAALGAALSAFFSKHSLPRRVRLGVSNQQIAVRSLELPRIEDEGERAMAVRFQAAETIAMPLEEAVFDYQVVGEAVGPEGPARMRVVVVAAREGMIAKLVEAVSSAGLKPVGIDLDAFALTRVLATPSTAVDEARVYCHLGAVVNLAVAVGRTCSFTRSLSVGRDEEGRPVAATLAEEVRLSMDFYMAQADARPVTAILLTGPDSARDGLADELATLLGLPVSVPDPLHELEADALRGSPDAPRYTLATGLALGAVA